MSRSDSAGNRESVTRFIPIILFVLCFGFPAMAQASDIAGKTVIVGDTKFKIPEEFRATYSEEAIHFALDAHTFQIIKNEGG